MTGFLGTESGDPLERLGYDLNAAAKRGDLEPAHQGCNSVRKDRTLDDWFAAHPVRARLEPSRSW